MNEPLWGEMLDVLKDIGEYLAKQDAHQEEAKIDKPPKISEGQKPIKGGEAPGFGPGKNALIAKEFPGAANEPRINETSNVQPEEGTLLKGDELDMVEEDEDVDGIPSRSSSTEDEDGGDILEDEDNPEAEFKSLLKDIRNALNVIKASSSTSKTKEATKSSKTSDSVSKSVVDGIVAEIKKALPTMINAESHRMLRKMGFSPSRPDIVKFGIDEDIKKSEDGDEKIKEIYKTVDDLSKKSWGELGALRETTGGFNAFR